MLVIQDNPRPTPARAAVRPSQLGSGHRVDLALVALTIVVAATAHAASPTAPVSIQALPGNPSPSDTITAEVFIDVGSVPLGAYSLTFGCDPTVLEIVGPVQGGNAVEFAGQPLQNPVGPCAVNISGFNLLHITTPTNTVSVARITLRVLPGAVAGTGSILAVNAAPVGGTGSELFSVTNNNGCIAVAGGGVCGDSFIDFCESCDDGNTTGGDCCTADCRFEIGPCSDGDACTSGDACSAGVCVGVSIPQCGLTTTTLHNNPTTCYLWRPTQ